MPYVRYIFADDLEKFMHAYANKLKNQKTNVSQLLPLNFLKKGFLRLQIFLGQRDVMNFIQFNSFINQ